MSEEKHLFNHLFHHDKPEDNQNASSEVVTADVYAVENVSSSQSEYEKALKEEKKHKREEHFGELGAAAAGAFALYEKHEEKKDPEHAHRHKIEEEIAAAAAVGAGGFVFHEHHEVKESEKEAEESDGKKHHHFF